MISHDQPIEKPGDDLFGRAPFALTLARSIEGLTVVRDGFVFALTGQWGDGKTSVLRLIVRYLLHLEMERLSRVKLPWQAEVTPRSISDLERMALLFERVEPTILELIRQNKYLFKARIDYQLSVFRDVLKTDIQAEAALLYWHLKEQCKPNVIIVRFAPWLVAGRAELASALLSELARGLNRYLGDEVKQAFSALMKRLAEFTPAAGAGLGLLNPGLGSIIGASESIASSIAARMSAGPTLDELRSRLQDVLRSLQDQRVLVILDDIDRLTPSEATEMVSLVKSLGDLPNVIYLLSYDREAVSRLIRRRLKVDGDRYLQKIVQNHVPLPPIGDDQLIAAVDAEIRAAFPQVSLDTRRLGTLWYQILRHYIKTPRDIRRYFNAVALAEPGLAAVTDPIDLMTLLALQVFDPLIYDFVREHLSELVS